jgi:PAS domain-containing protein
VKKSLGNDDFLNTILDKIPFPILLMDDDVRIHEYNLAAISLFGIELGQVNRVRCGDAFCCVYSMQDGCGESEACKECVIRNSVRKSYGGSKVVREKTDIQLVRDNKIEQIQMLVTAEPLKYNDELYVMVILEDIAERKKLRSILPIPN